MKYKYTCILDTPHALALYLLKMGVDAVDQTLFCVATLDRSIVAELPHVKRFVAGTGNWSGIAQRFFLRIRCLFVHFLYVRKTKIYAQDHLFCSAPLIYRKAYDLIEDGPGVCSGKLIGKIAKRKSMFRCLHIVFHGPLCEGLYGQNRQCLTRWVTSRADAEIYRALNRSYDLFTVKKLWQQASSETKNMVLRCMGGALFKGDYGRDTILNAKTVLLTQPFMEDCGLTAKEHELFYRSEIEKFVNEGVVIKPHPRDAFNYERAFPDCVVLRSMIPMQLICAMDVIRVSRVVTAFSSAISEFPDDTEVVWIDTVRSGKVQKICGRIEPPQKFKNVQRV